MVQVDAQAIPSLMPATIAMHVACSAGWQRMGWGGVGWGGVGWGGVGWGGVGWGGVGWGGVGWGGVGWGGVGWGGVGRRSTLEMQQWSRCPLTCSMVGSTGFACAAVDSATTRGLHRELAIPKVPTAWHACK